MKETNLFDFDAAHYNELAAQAYPSFQIESELNKRGYNIIAGVDEAGRGSLAGPLAVGLTIYDKSFIENPTGNYHQIVRDSKILSPQKREIAVKNIYQYSSLSEVEFISNEIIDKININNATEVALKRLLDGISIKPDIILIDGNFKFNLNIPSISIRKGDSKSISISSASIIAKVKRDKIFDDYDKKFPGYDMKKNKGYGTKKHRDAIAEIGYTTIHRKTYDPVKSIIAHSKGLFKNESSPDKHN